MALSGGVMVAQLSLEEFVMVRIHAGQPPLGAGATAAREPPVAMVVADFLEPSSANGY